MTNYLFQSDMDYSPIIFVRNGKIVREGDNIHDHDIVAYCDGYCEALDEDCKYIFITDAEELKIYEKELKENKAFEQFNEYIQKYC